MGAAAWEPEFTSYFTARVATLRRLAYAMCGDWYTAEDLVQATFVRLYRHWRTIRMDSIDAYTRRILVNGYLSHRRDRQRESVVADPPDLAAAPDTGPETRIDLGRALMLLPAQQRAMVVLRHLEDLSVAEVANVLGVAEGTVKSQTARGVAALRGHLSALASTKE